MYFVVKPYYYLAMTLNGAILRSFLHKILIDLVLKNLLVLATLQIVKTIKAYINQLFLN